MVIIRTRQDDIWHSFTEQNEEIILYVSSVGADRVGLFPTDHVLRMSTCSCGDRVINK